ncbi:hypothetical protein VTL71DRAFT_7959 [Oculimacula yallundae]|uniref:Uncharacterized protein n=1 Tax=Oculimacula yallundae TaxID=86028 RepID=A0ABR4CXI1_9HELO
MAHSILFHLILSYQLIWFLNQSARRLIYKSLTGDLRFSGIPGGELSFEDDEYRSSVLYCTVLYLISSHALLEISEMPALLHPLPSFRFSLQGSPHHSSPLPTPPFHLFRITCITLATFRFVGRAEHCCANGSSILTRQIAA